MSVHSKAAVPNGGTGGSSGYGRFGGIMEVQGRKIANLPKTSTQYAF